jgi:hypothetical protein
MRRKRIQRLKKTAFHVAQKCKFRDLAQWVIQREMTPTMRLYGATLRFAFADKPFVQYIHCHGDRSVRRLPDAYPDPGGVKHDQWDCLNSFDRVL